MGGNDIVKVDLRILDSGGGEAIESKRSKIQKFPGGGIPPDPP